MDENGPVLYHNPRMGAVLKFFSSWLTTIAGAVLIGILTARAYEVSDWSA